MCGLVGVCGTIYAPEKRVFRNLLELDVYRGPHSTGVAVIQHDKEKKDGKDNITIYKKMGRPWHLYAETDGFDEEDLIKKYCVKALIGHNRFATVGKKIDANAHPFRHGNIVGAHNGTLTREWLYKLEGSRDFDVDSEAIFYSLSVKGLRETVATMHGAWALTWYDGTSMNFLRNKERPLFFAWSFDNQTLYWASESWMIEVATAKEGVKIQKIHPFSENEHHYINLTGDGNIKKEKLYYDGSPVMGFTPPVVKYTAPSRTNSGANPFTTGYSNNANQKHSLAKQGNDKDKQECQALVGKKIEIEIIGETNGSNGLKYLQCESTSVPDTFEIRLYAEHMKMYEDWIKSAGYFLAKVRNVNVFVNFRTNKTERYITLDPRSISEEYFVQKTAAELSEINSPFYPEDPKEEPKQDNVVPFQQRKGPTVDEIIQRVEEDVKRQKEANKIILGSDLEWDATKEYTGWKGQVLTFSQFMKSIKNGCEECKQSPAHGEENSLVWIGQDKYICRICDLRIRTESALKRNNK